MNGGAVLLILACLLFVLAAVFAFEIAVFRFACLLCRVPQPGFFRTVGMVSVLLVVPGIVDAFGYAILHAAYQASSYPLWEADLVQFFLALPVHMGICSFIHAKMMDIRLGDALGVWFVEKLLKLVVLLGIAGVVAGIIAFGQLK